MSGLNSDLGGFPLQEGRKEEVDLVMEQKQAERGTSRRPPDGKVGKEDPFTDLEDV